MQWQLVPFWRAIFFTFAIVGFSVDVFEHGRYPLPRLVLVVIGFGPLGVGSSRCRVSVASTTAPRLTRLTG